jgi:hypothetical protein
MEKSERCRSESQQQGCQTVCFSNPNLGEFWGALQWKILVYVKTIRNMLWPFGIFCDNSLYYPHFGILYQEKSGNPGQEE